MESSQHSYLDLQRTIENAHAHCGDRRRGMSIKQEIHVRQFRNLHKESGSFACKHLGKLVGTIGCCSDGRQGFMCGEHKQICTIQKTPGLRQPHCTGCEEYDPDETIMIAGDDAGRWSATPVKPNVSIIAPGSHQGDVRFALVRSFLERTNGEFLSTDSAAGLTRGINRNRSCPRNLSDAISACRGEAIIVLGRGCVPQANCLEALLSNISRGQSMSFHACQVDEQGSRSVHHKVDPGTTLSKLEDLPSAHPVTLDVPLMGIFGFIKFEPSPTMYQPTANGSCLAPQATALWLETQGLLHQAVPQALYEKHGRNPSTLEDRVHLALSMIDAESDKLVDLFKSYPYLESSVRKEMESINADS
jgi:hypothetical protein